MLGDLRGATLLRGARDVEPADLDAVAEVVARVAALAEGLGDDPESLETSPRSCGAPTWRRATRSPTGGDEALTIG
ncbi:hypothetical protein ABZ860_11745 [Microbispora sp. NPDC046973]|uniref:hypothetical protein n=1 Tax=Microbispora sp. NPDC046973 TaxID=3155022 RepID=UPI0033C0AB90